MNPGLSVLSHLKGEGEKMKEGAKRLWDAHTKIKKT